MTDNDIIQYYKKGHSIDYITKIYHKYKNRKQKPVKINGITLFPAKIYTKEACRLYVCQIIYNYLIKGDLERTQTTSYSGRGAI